MLRLWWPGPGNSRCPMWGNTGGERNSTGGAEFRSRETEAGARQLDRGCTLKESVEARERRRDSLWVGAEAEAGKHPEVPGAIPRT
jgi:hypothetical protein